MIQDPIDQKILVLVKTNKTRNQGFRLLLDNYQRAIYWRIREMIKSHDDAADVMQNFLLKVSTSIDRFEGKAKLFSWLYKIATNEALSFLNREKRKFTRYSGLNVGVDVLDNDFEQELNAQNIQSLLAKAIESLPTKQKKVFRLRYYEEQQYSLMSKNLNTSEGALKASYHHAAKKIEQYLIKYYDA